MNRRKLILFCSVLLLGGLALAGLVRSHHRPRDVPDDLWKWEVGEAYTSLVTDARLPALHRAAGEGDTARVKYLLDHGAKVNSRDRDGWTALHWASFEGKAETVKLLLSRGADPIAQALPWASDVEPALSSDIPASFSPSRWVSIHKRDKRTPLKAALAKGRTEAAQVLLDHGAGKGQLDALLLWTARYGYAQGAAVLLSNGSRADAADADGWTALHWASHAESVETARVLLMNGANPNGRTTRAKTIPAPPGSYQVPPKTTPLFLAPGSLETLALLVDAGADVNAQNSEGNTPLLYTLRQPEGKALELLLSRGANPNTGNNEGKTPLFYALLSGDTEDAEILLAHGAYANAKDAEGQSPPHESALSGSQATRSK